MTLSRLDLAKCLKTSLPSVPDPCQTLPWRVTCPSLEGLAFQPSWRRALLGKKVDFLKTRINPASIDLFRYQFRHLYFFVCSNLLVLVIKCKKWVFCTCFWGTLYLTWQTLSTALKFGTCTRCTHPCPPHHRSHCRYRSYF